MTGDGVHGDAQDDLRDAVRVALRQVPMPVTVVLAHDGQEVRGATVSSVMPVSLDPPVLAIGVGKGRRLHPILEIGASCSVSFLGSGQEHLADHFASSVAREQGVHLVRLSTTARDVPCVRDAVAVFDCIVEGAVPGGDHTVVLLSVIDAITSPDETPDPLLWRDGTFAYLD